MMMARYSTSVCMYVYVYNAYILRKDIKCTYVKDAYMYMICRSLECKFVYIILVNILIDAYMLSGQNYEDFFGF